MSTHSTVGPIDIQPQPQEWISMQITNALGTMGSGIVVVRNPTLTSGEFLNDYPTRDHHYGSVHNCRIYPGMVYTISAHASKGWRGTSGTIPLYEGSRLICQLFWDCPGGGRQNTLQGYNVDGNYAIHIDAFRTGGPIGDVNITIRRA